ncbi:hypothetical protein EXIGLDRAFT_847573 [Exidia glandulosa HHB12029]|uniref:Uncharacterized protein n=1 Tax=Exidia glandulosa HHB12029 TaxID=1314781 RepID=A0A166MUM4_EXIGL|nr:hypothetical protein EXIGLDRAFT_847573 [Exidia glandulosa HHB12029]
MTSSPWTLRKVRIRTTSTRDADRLLTAVAQRLPGFPECTTHPSKEQSLPEPGDVAAFCVKRHITRYRDRMKTTAPPTMQNSFLCVSLDTKLNRGREWYRKTYTRIITIDAEEQTWKLVAYDFADKLQQYYGRDFLSVDDLLPNPDSRRPTLPSFAEFSRGLSPPPAPFNSNTVTFSLTDSHLRRASLRHVLDTSSASRQLPALYSYPSSPRRSDDDDALEHLSFSAHTIH